MNKENFKLQYKLAAAPDNITALQRTLVYSVYAQLKDSDPIGKKYFISIQELQKKLRQLGWEVTIDQIQEATADLIIRTYYIEEPSGDCIHLALFASVTYTDNSDIIEVGLSRTIRPYLFHLKDNFALYDLDTSLRLKARYSQLIYQILCQHIDAGVLHITVEKLKYFLSLVDPTTKEEQYKTWSSFSKDVLEVAKKEINNYTNIFFTYTLKKTGRKYTDITFHIKTKSVQRLLELNI